MDVENTIDAVPVVRCRECKFFRKGEENENYCKLIIGLGEPEEDDFCSYGKRKGGADNG